MTSIRLAETPEDIAAVKTIFTEYLSFIETYLGQSLSFQGTAKEFADFPHTYVALVLARIDGEPLAACGVKPFKDKDCELKRLYCRPAGRGHGLGEALCRAAIDTARTQGFQRMLLDTDHGLIQANRIYEQLGFRDVPKYYDNPMDSRFMALDLFPS